MANGTRKPMRQGQQSRRGRGRGRKPQNPLSRNLESNGPDVKIRGTASHIAEKYATLARDAIASGDPITGESYLQHAEHYNRIIMANQSQQGDGVNGSGAGRGRQNVSDTPGGGADGKQKESPAVSDATGKAADDATGKAADKEGVMRTVGRTVKRSSGNGADDADTADREDSEKDKSKAKSKTDDAPDEAVT